MPARLSAYDITYELCRRTSISDTDGKRETLTQVLKQIRSRWTPADILAGKKVEGGNLVDPERFYLHSAIHLAPPPPKIHWDIDSGEMVTEVQEYFLEMESGFTMEDLASYFERHLRSGQDMARVVGSLKWLIERLDLDTVLFMIDVYADLMRAEDWPPPTSPASLTDYTRDARQRMDRKRAEMADMGVDKIVPRQRTPLGGGRG